MRVSTWRTGAAILAGVGGGLWPSVDAACSAVVRVTERVRPNETSAAVMQTAYAAYRYDAATSDLNASNSDRSKHARTRAYASASSNEPSTSLSSAP